MKYTLHISHLGLIHSHSHLIHYSLTVIIMVNLQYKVIISIATTSFICISNIKVTTYTVILSICDLEKTEERREKEKAEREEKESKDKQTKSM